MSAFTAQFSWTPPAFGPLPTGYQIEAGFTPGETVVTLPAAATSLTIAGVPPGRYYVRVRAIAATGVGVPSNEIEVRVDAAGSGTFSAPQNFVGRINDRRLTLTWADPQTEGLPTSYVVEVGSAAGLSNVATLPLTARSFIFEGVPDGVYFVRVRARLGALVSPPSPEAMIAAGNVPSPPDAPRDVSHALSGSTLTLTWQAPFLDQRTATSSKPAAEVGSRISPSSTPGAWRKSLHSRTSHRERTTSACER